MSNPYSASSSQVSLSQIAVIRQGGSLLMIPLIIVMAVLIALFSIGVGLPLGIIFGICATYLYMRVAAQLTSGDLWRGFKSIRTGHYEQALDSFQRSYDFFNRHRWMDDYRYIILLNPSVMKMREMSLYNIACCHFYLNDGIRMYESYQRLLAEFPENPLGHSMVRMIELAKQIPNELVSDQQRDLPAPARVEGVH